MNIILLGMPDCLPRAHELESVILNGALLARNETFQRRGMVRGG